MATVDDRIVSMKFENSQFESAARTSMGTLAKLKESMSFGSIVGGTIRGLDTIAGALSRIGLKTPFAPMISAANKGLGMLGGVLDKLGMRNPFEKSVQGAGELQQATQEVAGPSGIGMLEGGITSVSNKFLLMSTVAVTAMNKITSSVIDSVTAQAKALLGINAMRDGYSDYNAKLTSVQTVMNATGKSMEYVGERFDKLDKYADDTIYDMNDMTSAIAKFSNAGVDLDKSVVAIEGIGNATAYAGQGSSEAALAYRNFSDAISKGYLGGGDFLSLKNSNVITKQFKEEMIKAGVAAGTLKKNANGTYDTLGKGAKKAGLDAAELWNVLGDTQWADQGVVMKTLNEYGDASTEMGKKAKAAAQDVRDFPMLLDTLKASAGTGWTQSFETMFGNVEEAKEMWTGVANAIGGVLGDLSKARNDMLDGWKKDGGRAAVIDGFKNGWKALGMVLKPIKEAFTEMFPQSAAKGLVSASEGFRDFMKALQPGEKTLSSIKSIAKGVFAILDIGRMVLMGVVGLFAGLFGAVGGGGNVVLGFAGNVGDMVVAFRDFLAESGLVQAVFVSLGKILAAPLALLKGFAGSIGGLFDGFKGFGGDLDKAKGAGEKLKEFFGGLGDFFSNIGKKVGGAVASIGQAIADLFTPETFERGLKVLEVGLLAGLILVIKKVFTKGVSIDLTGGLFDGIKETLGEATGAFQNMQQNLKADILIKIAIAIGIMALSLLVLSSIDPKSLAKALGAMSAGFAALIGAMVAMMKFMGPAGIVAMYAVSSMMTKVALSLLILAFALKILSDLKPGDIARGLVVLGSALYILQKAMIPLAKGSAGMVRAAASMILMGVALNLIAVSLKIFASMSWEELAKGLVGMAGALAGMVLAMRAMPKDMSVEAVTLMALAAAILVLSVAVKIFATMSWKEIGRGLTALAGTLVAVAVALRLMPKKMLLQAVALNAVATAITILAGALKIMGSMSWDEIEKGLIALGVSMLMMALGLQAMRGTLMGAAALVIAAQALAILIPVLVILGNLPLGVIITGLVALAATFAILGAAGYLIGAAVPAIIGLAFALLLIGASVTLVGAGLWLMAAAFATVVAAASLGMAVFSSIVSNVVLAIPKIAGAMAQGLLTFVATLAMSAPKIALAFAEIVNAILDQVILMIPKIGRLFSTLIATAIKVIVDAVPRFVTAGYRILAGILKGLDDNIYQIVERAISIIVKFTNGVADNIGDIVDAGFNLIIKFIEGLTKAIEDNSEKLGEAGVDLGIAIIDGVVSGLASAGGAIKDKLVELGKEAWQGVKDFFGVKSPSRLMRDTIGKPIADGMAVGIAQGARGVNDEMTNMGKTAMDKLGDTMKNIDDAVAIDPRMQPTVAPVLDLTALSKEANKIGGLLTTRPIRPRVSYSEASSLSAEIAEAEREREEIRERREAEPTNVTYEQHLHSPVPLDSVTIYRDSRSLIALKKEELFR